MPDDDFRNLFRTRHDLIQEADQAVVQAERAFGRAKGDNGARWTVIAAGKCERAAASYSKAGLGLLAKQQYAAASRYCCLVGDRERAKLNQDRWAAVPTYWEDDGDAANTSTRRKEPRMAEYETYDREQVYQELYQQFARMEVPPCPRCGTCDTATVQVGVIGLTIRLAATCSKFKLIPNGPKPGNWFCNTCGKFFDVAHESTEEGRA